MTRKTTWTNSDGLVVGFGPNIAERLVAGVAERDGDVKEARLQFTFASTTGASGAKITIPAGSLVKNVWLRVDTAFAGGTSYAFGDATTPAGWITAAQGALANLTPAGARIVGQGAYAVGGTDTTAARFPKVYAAATDLYLTAVGTFTAGEATIVVEYV